MENVGTVALPIQLSMENVRTHFTVYIIRKQDSLIVSLEIFWHQRQVLSTSVMAELTLVKGNDRQRFILDFWLRV